MADMESIWEYREEVLYPELFGKGEDEIFPLAAEDFAAIRRKDVDPRWLHLGVMAFAPTPRRPSWLYVTSGGSTPWDSEPHEYDAEDYSWLGVELVIETGRRADWPLLALRRLLAYQVLVHHGAYGDVPGLACGARVPLGGPIDPATDSALRFALITQPSHYPSGAQLESGRFDFLHVVGISESERDFAKVSGNARLIEKLALAEAYPVTDPARIPVA